jgi:hypothetical protein
MAGLYEVMGREADRAVVLEREYDKLLALLSGIASGGIDPRRLKVDLVARTWFLAPESSKELAGELPGVIDVPDSLAERLKNGVA